ncbi:MAG: HAMP domain-containing histidine kinase [Candidatus Omnitrophica bacterium]|nr:HAMP domain-containing histidine kinase [Candidatus Omnitrophota bacterium]
MNPNRASARLRSYRTLFIRFLPILSVLLIDVFFLAMLENLFYNKKRALILEPSDRQTEMKAQIDPIRIGLSRVPARKDRIKEYIQENAPEILSQDNPWFRVRLTDEDNVVEYEYEDKEKYHRLNDGSNCFLSRSFEAISTTQINDKASNKFLYNLTFYYTSPKDWPSIERMVIRYWLYAGLFIAASWIVFIWLSFSVLRPLERVGQAIEGMIQSDGVVMIQSPRHAIERRFNQLARNQREVLFGLEIERIVDELHSLTDDAEVLECYLVSVQKAVYKIYPVDRVDLYVYAAGDQGLTALSDESPAWPETESEELAIRENEWIIPLKAGGTVIGGVQCRIHRNKAPRLEMEAMAGEIKKQAENGLARAFTRSRALIEERNRFGINLATNMGHDLTNIIASGKWDLDTIQRVQNLGIVTMDPQKGSFFQEAVLGLRNNLHFLQEMVNIYRSFGYTRNPRYEPINLAEVIEQAANLFRLSTSQKLSVDASIPESISITAEPRLLRMAFFNLLANAAQAIRRSDPRKRGEIFITVQEESDRVVASVRDNGPGIRDKNGDLLQRQEIRRIFQSGYSTKTDSSGGGLGLSWVQSIIEDFHHGAISADNLKEGGACFTLILPLRCNVDNESK